MSITLIEVCPDVTITEANAQSSRDDKSEILFHYLWFRKSP